MPESEWDEFLKSMRRDLPTAFRISAACPQRESARLLDIVRGEFFERLINEEIPQDAEEDKDVRRYPDSLGWQMELSRKDIRRCESYFRLHNFLMKETACGAISRQETVSMIPPLLLDVQPHHKVLDMCAAPGSKTAQLIELLHSGESKVPDGFVIANDIDNSRCYMLVHQAKRLNSPSIAITNHDSSTMPNLYLGGQEERSVKFDRILCDVPCSGDGTLRKNADIWPKWNTANANNLHGIQYRIVKRGLELLEVGGRLVYSTCSLNPVENEAVICRILAESAGSVELVEVSERVPGLRWSPGLSTWLPASRDLSLYSAYDQVDEKWRTVVRPSIMRILPHHQDTGGFFVAALVKQSRLPWEATQPKAEDTTARQEPARKKRRVFGYREDPYVFFEPEEPVWLSIRDFYDMSADFGSTCLLTRCTFGKKKNIYFVSPQLKRIISTNQTNVKIINTGVKVFARCDNKSMGCSFRLVQEGLESIKKYIGDKRRLSLPKEELVEILFHTDPTQPLDVDKLSDNTRKRIEEISPGSCVLDYSGDDLEVTLVGWRGSKSIRAYVALEDAVHYLRLLGAPVEKFGESWFRIDFKGGKQPDCREIIIGGAYRK
ncbi:hypothetical protein AAG570_007553 [Ranatra chinensis]|uniref:tRNA (cytosine(34)-C(5))-methyltransferase n=1 Tax=Ranatra chinensis TaxID=642074 RepID=A0ABD0XW71_9HEMI